MSSGARTTSTERLGRSMRKGPLTASYRARSGSVPDITAKHDRAIAERSFLAGPNRAPSATAAAMALPLGFRVGLGRGSVHDAGWDPASGGDGADGYLTFAAGGLQAVVSLADGVVAPIYGQSQSTEPA